MVLANPPPTAGGLNSEAHVVPTVHLEQDSYASVRSYAATPGATASISRMEISDAPAPQVAAFSSRGPAHTGGGNVLTPVSGLHPSSILWF